MAFGGIENFSGITPGQCPLMAVVKRIENKAKAEPSFLNLADTAIGQLAYGRANRAIAILEEISRKNRDNVVVLTDLSAAYLVRSGLENQPHDLVLSIEASKRAVSLDAFAAEARFNLALSLEKLLLFSRAEVEWTNFLRLDRTSNRARVAALHIERIGKVRLSRKPDLDKILSTDNQVELRNAVDRFPQDMRVLGEEGLLFSWAKDVSIGDEGAARRVLDKAQVIGEILSARASGDQMLIEATEAIRKSQGNGHRKRVLMEGYLEYQKGSQLIKARLHRQARPHFAKAYRYLGIGNSSFRYWALTNAAVCDVNLGNYEGAIRNLSSVFDHIDVGPFPTLAGRAEWVMGLANLKLAKLSVSLELYRSALNRFKEAGEFENAAALYFLLAENLRLQGEIQDAWRYRHEAVKYADMSNSYVWHSNALFDSAEAAIRENLLNVALVFQGEMVDLAGSSGEPILMAEALLRRARTHAIQGDQSAARGDIAEAERALTKISSPDRREHVEVDLWTKKADLLMKQDPQSAENYLSKTLVRLTKSGERFRLPDLFWRRAMARLAMGKDVEAHSDLELAVAEVLSGRQRITSEPLSVLYSDNSNDIFTSMIEREIELGDYESALNYLEKEKCFDCASEDTLPVDLMRRRSLIEQIPDDTAVLSYLVKSNKILVFSIARGEVFLRIMQINTSRLESIINKVSMSLERDDLGHAKKMLSIMHRVLIAPAITAIQGHSKLLIIPDGILFRVPFSLLNNQGRLLVEDFEITVSPSLILTSVAKDVPSQPRNKSILVLADSAFDRKYFDSLPRLPGARLEAEVIAKQYDKSELLIDVTATRKAFLFQIGKFDVIHVAVHGGGGTTIMDPAFLILAPDDNEDDVASGLLYSQDIGKLRLNCLVILASCRAAGGAVSSSGINVNLARSFVRGGARGVLASLWQVDDAAAGPFLVRLHQLLAAGGDIGDSLGAVQRECAFGAMKDRCPPSVWGSFELFR